MSTRSLHKSLFVQVLVAIAAAALLGYLSPERAAAMRPLGTRSSS